MSDPKAERLLNLTIALLATRRYLTKSEIFSSVAGYEGSQEAMERMFERDKGDLRSLGIEIEVGTIDPLFEDEAGYRIRPDNYGLELGSFTPRELSLLSTAAQVWRDASLSKSSQQALRKLRALGTPIDGEETPMGWVRFEGATESIEPIWQALESRSLITFTYDGSEITQRRVRPYGVAMLRGFWYLAGFDLDKSDVRIFKTSRIVSAVELSGKTGAYEIPEDFSISEILRSFEDDHPQIAKVLIRRDKCHLLRNEASVSAYDDDWDMAEVPYFFDEYLIKKVLWFGPDAAIVEPLSLSEKIAARISEAIDG